ncbi:hypothetical protein P7C70_g9071, partial [Phenoliferia sp. Uapishka_3]
MNNSTSFNIKTDSTSSHSSPSANNFFPNPTSATNDLSQPRSSHSRDPSPSPFSTLSRDPSSQTTQSTSINFPSSSSSTEDRGRPPSRNGHSPGPSTDSTLTTHRRSIRFAPLPEVRPRSYSTGRNIWYAPEGDVTEEALPRNLFRKDSVELQAYADSASAVADSSSSEEELTSSSTGIFGSWKSDLGMGGSSGHSGKESEDAAGSSYTSKLLRPLSFGLVGGSKKNHKKSSHRRSLTTDPTSTSTDPSSHLSRTESNDSTLSRIPSSDGIFRSSGVPMRKARTWELGETPLAASRRANYPPVAQRSRSRQLANQTGNNSTSLVDPSFVEWGWGKE